MGFFHDSHSGFVHSAALLVQLVTGLSIGWASPYLAQFAAGTNEFPATTDEISWMATSLHIGRFSGAILGVVSVQYFGSRTTMIGNGCALIIAWCLVIPANSVSWIFVSRFICGASIEVSSISFPIYLGDISRSSIRGAIVSLASNGFTLGILVGTIMGPYVSMTVYACITLGVIISFLIIFLCLHDSPSYLTSKGKIKDAENSILSYNPKADVYFEMQCITKYLTLANSMTFVDRLREFNISHNRIAGFILIAMCMFAQCSGLNPLAAYMEIIVTRGQSTVITPATVTIITNSLGIIAGWMTAYFMEKFGRKVMWTVSSAGCCGAMIALGTHFYLLDAGVDPVTLQWLPVFSMFTFQVSVNLGITCIPHIIQSELFAPNIRTLAAGGACITASIFAIISMSSYQYLLELIDEAYIYWMYAVILLLSAIFGLVLVPEMKGKTLLQIQDGMVKS